MTAEAIRCPNCQIYNPAGSRRCDCGWEFGKSRADQSIPIAPQELNGIRGWLLLFAIGLGYSFALHVVTVLVSVRALPLGDLNFRPSASGCFSSI